MSKQPPKRGLGRGLGSLIPTAPAASGNESTDGAAVQSDVRHSDLSAGATSGPSVDPGSTDSTEGRQIENSDLAPVDGAYFAELPVKQIHPNHVQPRQVFDEEAMAELVHSISEIGLLQPIVVRKVATDSYELVMGERRWRATQKAGLDVIPAIVRETDDTDMLRDALLENLHRSQLNPLEEAAAYQQLLNDFACTHDELAQRIGRSRPQISNTIRLLKLSPSVQRRVAAGVLSAGHARALLAVDGEAQQDKLAQKVVAEGISVRGLEEIVALGDPDGDAFATPRVRRAKPTAPGLKEISDRLSDRFDTRVKVDLGRSKGKITVEFATLDDLRRIVDLMSPAADESI
ncbi:ParB/RepB/Spo0J family partition protein [Nocardioides sp. KC13]|uniref:ParB/RepB/Spo0J family partition protein n=1 Tax=Nocardioides turkmenicus TaxID=2711220 RepID=A0A6M1QYG8_9ACTN|nr:ParB/RepB/Spo0J family partition protein [Nocardioides sp. KC13]NGN95033.1 ParB/RepB/Spo0J family partition protein [Nocardioides sp. KC13]